METKQTKDSTKQVKHDKNLYELMLYVVGNNKKIQLAFDNLKEVCYKYLAEKCYIMVIDLAKNPNLARVRSDHSHSYSCEKGLPRGEDHRRSRQSRKGFGVPGYTYQ